MKDRHTGMAVDAEVHRLGRERVNHFLSLSSAPLLLPFFASAHNPVKEITESMGAWLTLSRWANYRGVRLSDPGIVVVVPGDGVYPRTGALIAVMSRCDVVSVDPMLRFEGAHPTFHRLTGIRARLGDAGLAGVADFVVSVHSHAPVADTRAVAKPGGIVISIPCCISWPTDAGEVFVDPAMISPDRRVIVERRAA